MWGLPRSKVQRALFVLALAEAPVALQILDLDRSYLFFAFGLAWAAAFYNLVEPKPRALPVGLLVYAATAFTAIPLLLAWLNLVPPTHQLPHTVGWQFVRSFGIGVREELCKATTVVAAVWIGSRLATPFSSREGMVYGAMSGLAFASVENLEAFSHLHRVEELTIAHGLDPAAWTIAATLGRLVLTPLVHACWAATVGFALTAPGRTARSRAALGVGALALVAVLHGLYDACAALGNHEGVGALLALSFGIVLFLVSRTEQIPEVEPAREPTLVTPAPLAPSRLALPLAVGAAILGIVGWSLARLFGRA